MQSEDVTAPAPVVEVRFTADDVAAILRERGWLAAETAEAIAPSIVSGAKEAVTSQRQGPSLEEQGGDVTARRAWQEDAAALLGPRSRDRAELTNLLGLIFQYDAPALLATPQAHEVLVRVGAREVIRELALLVLDGRAMDSDRFKEVVAALKNRLRYRGRELFGPIRLALAGRPGEGELDRVILLLDRAAELSFRVAVKGTRQRMREFCAALE